MIVSRLHFSQWLRTLSVVMCLISLHLIPSTPKLSASCAAPDEPIFGRWLNVNHAEGNSDDTIFELTFHSACGDNSACPIGERCMPSANIPFWAILYFMCADGTVCRIEPELAIGWSDASGSKDLGDGALFLFSATVYVGEHGFDKLNLAWWVEYKDSTQNYGRVEEFVRFDQSANYVALARRPTATTTSLPVPTPLPTLHSTPFPTPISMYPSVQNWQPISGSCLTKGAQFQWQDSNVLTSGHLYEIIVWHDGEDPVAHGLGMASSTDGNRLYIDLDTLNNYREWFTSGTAYYWGILDVTTEPYIRHRLVGVGGWFWYVRHASCPERK